MSTKIVMGLMVAAISVLMSTAGIVGATPGHGGNPHWTPPGHGGTPPGHGGISPGHGYGGTTINTDIRIGDIVGNNNVINIVINYFSGH